jgi:hypothetical protein
VSVKVMTMVWEIKLGSAARKAVLLKLADCASDSGECIFPSKRTIADATELSTETVKRVLREFREEGVLRVVRWGGPTAGPTRYRMDLGKLRGVGSQRPQGGVTVTPNPSIEPRTEKKGTRKRDSLPHSRGGGTHAAVVEPVDRGNPLNAWGAE